MCGIVGYVGQKPFVDVVVRGLKRLEYRGYDSSGLARIHKGDIEVFKAAGKITEMEKLVSHIKDEGHSGAIGHTRWATHGKPSSINAHPHRVGPIVLVHNGIIENYHEILLEIQQKGLQPVSETDSELFGFLVQFELNQGLPFIEAVRQSFLKVRGACSLVLMHQDHPGLIVGIRNGSPLVAAQSKELGAMVASDAQPILDHTNDVYYLENGDMVICKEDQIRFVEIYSNKPVERKATHLEWSADRLDKNGYAHYMLKEIHEQSRTIRDTLASYLNISKASPFEFTSNDELLNLQASDKLTIVACGTSWHAGLLGKYWFERWTHLSTETELASEYRYRSPILRKNQVVMGISQSGETADTLAVIREMKAKKIPTAAITNVKGSNISRESNTTFFTQAGPEIGVASTKAFTAQMLMLLLLAGRLSKATKGTPYQSKTIDDEIAETYKHIFELPHLLDGALEETSEGMQAVKRAAKATCNSSGFFFIGRGYSFPLALEGALKLKEIAYVHAEGYAAGELKHGPIAMLEPNCTVVIIAPRDAWYEKTISNLQEVKARGAKIVSIGAHDDHQLAAMSDYFIPLPAVQTTEVLNPFFIIPYLQLFSYEIAVIKGTDVDQPRNLAKSVTVE